MDTRVMVLLGGVAFIALMIIVMFYSVRLQRKAVGTQDATVSKVDESIELQRKAVALGEEGVALHKEANRLLSVLAHKRE